jgi:hypothetical protein
MYIVASGEGRKKERKKERKKVYYDSLSLI